jgi:hypothetical protein
MKKIIYFIPYLSIGVVVGLLCAYYNTPVWSSAILSFIATLIFARGKAMIHKGKL